MPETLTVACCQTVPDVEHPATSAAQARSALRAAVELGAQIVVLPELCHSGYVFASEGEARAAAVPADGELLAGWAAEAARGDAVVIGGFCELGDDGRVFNSAAVVDRDGVIAVYRKLHLWNDEASWFTAGEQPAPVVETRHGRIGVGVCYDIEFPELTRGLALAGAELIALPTNWPREPGAVEPAPHLLARATAYFSHVYVAVCDRGGDERGIGFQGASIIAGPRGTALAAAAHGATAETVFAGCDLHATRDKRTGPRNDAVGDRRPQHYLSNLSNAAASGGTEGHNRAVST
ncbi:MAG TPA: nitrilase-related carbon-nitrogen hydrolase [Solirubrobacteraceae bacterium]|nr:nitrilase-related carbon-nitrogen hydrolase [Solirubrobacteraceae bacterium]